MSRTQTVIPASLRPFFQEYDLAHLDLDEAAGTIIERTLRFGSRGELRWLFSCYGEERILGWVQRWGGRALPGPDRAFWSLLLDVPELS